MVILVVLAAAALLFQRDTMPGTETKENPVISCDGSDLSAYHEYISINGEDVESAALVVTYNSKIFFAISVLQEKISDSFIRYDNGELWIRRNRVQEAVLLKCAEQVYIDFDTLMDYANVNKDVLRSTGAMYIDTMNPLSVTVNGTTYLMSHHGSENMDIVGTKPDLILFDGRGAWYGKDAIYIEDDWGRAFLYEKDKTSI